MDPFTILGVASNIVAFVDFGITIVTTLKELRDAPHGTTREIHELNLIVSDIRSLSNEVLRAKPTDRDLSENERQLVLMASECSALATELSDILTSLRVRDGAAFKTLESGRVFFRTLRKRNDVDGVLVRLERFNGRLEHRVNQAIRESQNSAIMLELKALRGREDRLGIVRPAAVDQTLITALQLTEPKANAPPTEASQRKALKEILDSLERESRLRRRQTEVVDSLFFVELQRRWDMIKSADRRTNDWIFDSDKTTFIQWLESGSGIYWITGRAGSGKSTLMKFASEHDRTIEALRKWAHPAVPYHPSFYFWNQGFEMQKTQRGLLQSLLYQILRRAPGVIPDVVPDELDVKTWDVRTLKATLLAIMKLEKLPAKFCFFIDGLDEYDGEEEDLIELFSYFADTPHLKLCVSSRPRLVLDEAYQHRRIVLAIEQFTKEGMMIHVQRNLQTNNKFRQLRASGPACDEIMTQIAEQAHGVWLWVDLVTHALVHAVNRDEGIPMLQQILRQFPPSLEEYFEHMIRGVKANFRTDMAKIFLITIEEVQPLPLFAFALLEREGAEPDYAIKSPILPLSLADLEPEWAPLRNRIQNRCRDLLVIEPGQHPTFLVHPVDFLHRTVRDFLRDCYYERLQKELQKDASDFNPLVSLCNIMLSFLKSLPSVNPRERLSITRFIKLVDELLYYACEAEKREPSSDSPVAEILDEMDRVGRAHTTGAMRNHWTHVRDTPAGHGYDEYPEGGNCTFLALAIQARLVKYVRCQLQARPDAIKKKSGRPLLDYALRPRRITPISMPYHSRREEASVDIGMVELLLEHGADPNQQVHLNGGRTVWALFLLSCYESTQRGEASRLLKAAWYQACELLIARGARENCRLVDDAQPLDVSVALGTIFGSEKAGNLVRRMQEANEQRTRSSWFPTSWLGILI